MKKIKFQYKLTFLYLLLGILWIVFSDLFINQLIENDQLLATVQSLKGSFYVIITAIILFIYTNQHIKKLDSAKKRLRETGERYKALYEDAPLAFQSLDINGFFIDVNPKWLQTLGYAKEEVLGKSFTEFMHPNDVAMFKKRFSEFKKHGLVQNAEFKLKKKDGSYLIVEYEGSLGKNKDGTFKNTFCTFKDITKEYLTKEELKQSNLFTDSLIETANVMIVGLDNTGAIQIFNPFASELTGYTIEELKGKNWFDTLIPKSIFPDVWQEFLKLLEGNLPKRFENPILTKDGVEKIISWSNNEIYNLDNEIIGSISFGIDVTSKRRIEKELEDNQYLLHESQKLAKIGNWSIDFADEKVKWSEELYSIYGIDPANPAPSIEEFKKMNTPKTSSLLTDKFENLLKTKDAYELEGIGLHSSGKQIHIFLTANGIFNDDGDILKIYGTVQDITEQKKIEKELILAKEKAEESDRLKSAFLTNLSHEIRTPMNGILGFTQLLRTPDLTSEKKDDYIKIVQNSGNYLLSIINDIIEIARLETNQISSTLEDTNVNSVFHDVFDEMRITIPIEKRIVLINDQKLPSDECIIVTDNVKFKQAIINLISNAIKYTHSGEIKYGCKKIGENTLQFHVKDTGMGIKKEHQNVIFDRFRQIDENSDALQYGSGLGLSITKSYIELLGGKIWVESDLGKGSNFYFTLPIDPRKKDRTSLDELTEYLEENENGNMTIMIVEDDDINYQYLYELLSGPNKEIIHAKDGQEAVDICTTNTIIDLVLMDIKMPRMDGYEALKFIKEMRPDLKIIAHTAYSQNPKGTKLLAEGFDGFLGKPLDKHKLFILIQSLN